MQLVFLDFPQMSSMFFGFHARSQYFPTFGDKSPATNKTMLRPAHVWAASGLLQDLGSIKQVLAEPKVECKGMRRVGFESGGKCYPGRGCRS